MSLRNITVKRRIARKDINVAQFLVFDSELDYSMVRKTRRKKYMTLRSGHARCGIVFVIGNIKAE